METPYLYPKESSRRYLSKYLQLLNYNSPLASENKMLIYKSIIKPMWSCGIQLWGIAAKSHIEICQRFQSKTLSMIANASYYMTNRQIQCDLGVPFVDYEIGSKYYSCKQPDATIFTF